MTPEELINDFNRAHESLQTTKDAKDIAARLAAAEKYIAADQAYDVALRHAEYGELDKQKTARDAALAEWNAAKGGTR